VTQPTANVKAPTVTTAAATAGQVLEAVSRAAAAKANAVENAVAQAHRDAVVDVSIAHINKFGVLADDDAGDAINIGSGNRASSGSSGRKQHQRQRALEKLLDNDEEGFDYGNTSSKPSSNAATAVTKRSSSKQPPRSSKQHQRRSPRSRTTTQQDTAAGATRPAAAAAAARIATAGTSGGRTRSATAAALSNPTVAAAKRQHLMEGARQQECWAPEDADMTEFRPGTTEVMNSTAAATAPSALAAPDATHPQLIAEGPSVSELAQQFLGHAAPQAAPPAPTADDQTDWQQQQQQAAAAFREAIASTLATHPNQQQAAAPFAAAAVNLSALPIQPLVFSQSANHAQ
jgi:hypothetical protein